MSSKDSFDPQDCCGRFDPEPWRDGDLNWVEKPFIRDRVRSVFHIPINFGGVMRRNMELLERSDTCPEQMVILSDENSLWGADVYLPTSKDIPDASMERLSGRFITRLFEGLYSKGCSWAKEMKAYIESRGLDFQKIYFYYTTWPKCAKALGRNYVVLVAQVGA